MTRAPRPLLALALLLAAAPVPAQEPAAPGVLERLAELLRPGRPIGFQVVFEALETDDDVDFNTTVAEARRIDDAKGRHLVVATASYEHDGQPHRFAFLIREGELALVELQRRRGEAWERVAPDVFSFAPGDDGTTPDLLGQHEAVLVVRGHCTPRRGATMRKRAVVALRTFHSAEGRPLAY
ncbi:MAG: hypothetical protein M9894_01420 [Planctomycetes bacterium]|nr:hypothetical protein [Planctomycetota bacterium]